jgi:hypothetical protein
LYIKSSDNKINAEFEPLLGLIDVLMNKATAKQNKVLYLKLSGKNEEEIAVILGVFQPTVNQHSTSAGWNAIEKAVLYFENSILTKLEEK